MRSIWRVGLLLLLLLAGPVLPAFPVHTAQAGGGTLSYPVLSANVSYYQTTFPSGLRYSKGWYGTFAYAPPAAEILLFDDDWTADFGRAIFSMPAGIVPTGAQGGTTLTPISLEIADAILKSYPLDETAKPFDAEIQAVMKYAHYFTGAWMGDKLKQKWTYGGPVNPKASLSARQKDYIADTYGRPIKSVDLAKYDPDRFWVGDGGNWSDNTTHWAATSGGAPGASLPTTADSVFFDANSFTIAGQAVTVDAAANAYSMNWTGATNSPTLDGNASLSIYGSIILISDMTFSKTGNIYWYATDGGQTLTTAGKSIASILVLQGGSKLLSDNLTIPGANYLQLSTGSFNTGNFTLNLGGIDQTAAGPFTLTLGSSAISISGGLGWDTSGAGFVLPANTSTINITGTGPFNAGTSIHTYNNVNLNGTAHTVSGNFTAASFTLLPNTTQTITFTGGSTTNATTLSLTGSIGKVKTLTGATGWNLLQSAGTITADYVNLTNSQAAGGATFNAVGASVNNGGNTGWNWPLTVTTQAATGVTMDKDGVTGGNFNGTLVDMGGAANTVWFDYGLTAPAYGSTTAPVAALAPSAFSAAIPASLTPGATYHFRSVSNNGTDNGTGADQSFTFTMPTVTTGAATIGADATKPTLHGNLTNMGVASDVYVAFQYSYSSTFATFTTTPLVARAATGAYTATLSGINPAFRLYFRAIAEVVPTIATGSSLSYLGGSTGPGAGAYLLYYTFLIIAAAGVVIAVLVSLLYAGPIAMFIMSIIGLVGFALLAATLNTVILGG